MLAFARLLGRLDPQNPAAEALCVHLRDASPGEAGWTVFLLAGGTCPRLRTAAVLREWVREGSGLPDWLAERCFDEDGDPADLLAALWPRDGGGLGFPLSALMEEILPALRALPEAEQQARLAALWDACTRDERYVLNKLLGGGLRLAGGRGLVLRALELLTGLPPAVLEPRLHANWTPDEYPSLLATETSGPPSLLPLPFSLPRVLAGPIAGLGACAGWQAEWHWGGHRAQVLLDKGKVLLWSIEGRGLNSLFPEIAAEAEALAEGSILEGEILAWRGERPLGFRELDRRLRGAAPEIPVVFMATDCLAVHGIDLRGMPLRARRQQAFPMIGSLDLPHFRTSEDLPFRGWAHLEDLHAECRVRGVDGILLRRGDAIDDAGWQWKAAAFTVDAVPLYALAEGPGRIAELTFGLWGEGELLPFARIALKDHEDFRAELETLVREHTHAKQGPVRLLRPALVAEIAFDGLALSKRHKSGLAVRNPRLLRLRPDLAPTAADALADVRGWI